MKLILADDLRRDPAECSQALEQGSILFFPQTPFDIPSEDRQTLLGATQAEGAHHKNISYKPAQDRVGGLGDGDRAHEIHAALRRFSTNAIDFAGRLLPHYKAKWRIDYASFRGIEEAGRDLPLKKRNDLLHTDAFPTRPTNGDLILRFFTNINPERERVWLIADPFSQIAGLYAQDAGLERIAKEPRSGFSGLKRIARAVGLPATDRSPYDKFMLSFHDYLKQNEGFQKSAPKYRFEFPPNSSWMVYTDVVPHAVLSGQHALEQTFLIARDSLKLPECAPASVLERLAGRQLTN